MALQVDDEQASLIADAIDAQRLSITSALERLAADLGFGEDGAAYTAGARQRPEVLRVSRRDERVFLFVGLARGFGEPADDLHHQVAALAWLRRFARLLDKRRGKGAPRIEGGYVIVGTHDAAAAHAWAALLTTTARSHRIRRDDKPVRFAVRRLGKLWMAC